MSPQMALNYLNDPTPYTEKTDVWSLGIIAYELLGGILAFGGGITHTVNRVFARSLILDQAGVSKPVQNFIVEKLLSQGELGRPTAEEAAKTVCDLLAKKDSGKDAPAACTVAGALGGGSFLQRKKNIL